MPLILGANSVSGYTVKNSLRFNFASSDNLSITPASSGNRNTWTLSFWIKKDVNGVYRHIYNTSDTGNSNTNLGQIYFDNADKIAFFLYTSSTAQASITTTQVFRDLSAWYHIVIAYDDTQATASNRVKFYANGLQITSFSVSDYPSQNLSGYFNMNQPTFWGKDAQSGGTSHLSGYLSETYFINGQQLTPSSFGETDTLSGIWIPKAYTGSYGTNGFNLQFKNSASLGTDSSGNGNTFTANNLTSVDQSTDTCTNNFCTMNVLDNYYFGATFSEGNLKVVTNASNENYGTGTFGVSAGKWYWEVKVTSSQNYEFIGITDIVSSTTSFTAYTSALKAISYYAQNGTYYTNGSNTAYGNTYTTNDIIGVALDITNGKLYYSKNGTFQNSGDPVAGTNGISISSSPANGVWFPQVGEIYTGSSTMELNFGSPPFTISSGNADGAGYGNFEYAVPSGYYSLNTKNLANFG